MVNFCINKSCVTKTVQPGTSQQPLLRVKIAWSVLQERMARLPSAMGADNRRGGQGEQEILWQH
jgi:hypothetical protein